MTLFLYNTSEGGEEEIIKTKLGQSARHEDIPWFVCIYHKYTCGNDEIFDCIAFEPKAYNEDDKVLADSSFGFKVSEQSYGLVPYDLMQVYYDEPQIHNRASFYQTRMMDTNELKDYSIDFIKCDDEHLFYQLYTTGSLFIPDMYKDHQNDRDYSIEAIIEGINKNLPIYGMPMYWDNGLIGKKRD